MSDNTIELLKALINYRLDELRYSNIKNDTFEEVEQKYLIAYKELDKLQKKGVRMICKTN